MHPQVQKLLKCIQLEEKEQIQRFKLDQTHSLKQLKAEGLALSPLVIIRKNFGYADYPEINFKLNFLPEANLFKDGAAIECFYQGEEPIKGILLCFDGRFGDFRLFAPDFPDWIENHGVGIKLAPDTRTTSIMKKAMESLEKNTSLFALFEQLHGTEPTAPFSLSSNSIKIAQWHNQQLNESQKKAVEAMMNTTDLLVVHGPPGTGKTTTLTEGIRQLIKKGEKILVSAPSNTAVDNIVKSLIKAKVKVLRVGNVTKADEAVFAHTPEGKLGNNQAQQKEIKQLKKRAEEFRRMALKYKRSFGKAEREQRNLLFKEVKNIRADIKKLQAYNEEKLYTEAEVIAGTPVALTDAGLQQMRFSTLVMDEAGQCIEPLAWTIFSMADAIVLAGDHWQLPPTVLSRDAAALGYNRSILEVAIHAHIKTHLLDVQYRMRPMIAGFSSDYFYDGLLKSAQHLTNTADHLVFIDTAGSGFSELAGPDGVSLQNEGELNIVVKLMQLENIDATSTAFISPYAGQVAAAKEKLPSQMRISTIDSFQGQEKQTVIVSLVRSNSDNQIGFLKDYRRMNVAITRAQEKLIVIGDSATIGADKFFHAFLSYVESHGNYRTVWEFEI